MEWFEYMYLATNSPTINANLEHTDNAVLYAMRSIAIVEGNSIQLGGEWQVWTKRLQSALNNRYALIRRCGYYLG